MNSVCADDRTTKALLESSLLSIIYIPEKKNGMFLASIFNLLRETAGESIFVKNLGRLHYVSFLTDID